MKHKDMLPLMGKIVTVHANLVSFPDGNVSGDMRQKWESLKCLPWVGWIVGFTYKLDGKIIRDPEDTWLGHRGFRFQETSRQLCVLVTAWPTKKSTTVPLEGYELGGEPVSPHKQSKKPYKEIYGGTHL